MFLHSNIQLPKDPVELERKAIDDLTNEIGYICSENFLYYVVINHKSMKIVLGPSRQMPLTEQEIKHMAFLLELKEHELEAFSQGMKSINTIPIEALLQMLFPLNFLLNGSKVSLTDLAIEDSQQKENEAFSTEQSSKRIFDDEKNTNKELHNTYAIEQTLLSYIRKGDLASLNQWLSQAPSVRGGIIAPDQLRQRKNTFIVTATLASRAAISGGLDIDEAFSLSDSYIQKCEHMSSPSQIVNLQFHMIMDFTRRVDRLRHGESPSSLALEVTKYIWSHISEPISTEDLAAHLSMSRSHLSRRFKAETGKNLSDKILQEKIEEAKRLLRFTNKSLASISLYLGFSSQSHFSRAFHKITDLSPSEYRQG